MKAYHRSLEKQQMARYIEDNAISGKPSRKRWGEDDLLML